MPHPFYKALSFCAILSVGVLSSSLYAQSSATVTAGIGAGATPTRVFFHNIRVFDGINLMPSTNVLVEGEKITKMGLNITVPPGTDTIEGAGKTLLPGLIDAHAHVYGTALEDAIMAGVTTELDMFSDPEAAATVRKAQEAGEMLDQADLYSSGILVTAPGGHGTEYGFPIPTLSSPDSAQVFVDDRLREGSDYIKIVYDHGDVFGMHIPTLSKQTLKAVIDAAHKRDRMAVVHIGSLAEARDAIEAGADGLMHVSSDVVPDESFTKLARDHKTFVVPTLAVIRSATGNSNAGLAKDSLVAPFLTIANATNLSKHFSATGGTANFDAASNTVRALKKARVIILAGTDAPNPGTAHGASLHQEMELLTQSGLTPLQAIVAATAAPAEAFHLRDRGRVAVGYRADLLLISGDPSKDIRATRNIISVWKRGHQVNRAPYLVKVAAERMKFDAWLTKPAPEGSESGVISDFESGLTARFGKGWTISTDKIRGGASVATDTVVTGGANASGHSLLVRGVVDPGLQYAWAGVAFTPGKSASSPANLSSRKELRMWVKGDGRKYTAMFFTSHGGYSPSSKTFTASAEWTEIVLPFSDFDGMDGRAVLSLVIAAGPKPGTFQLQIDDVRLN